MPRRLRMHQPDRRRGMTEHFAGLCWKLPLLITKKTLLTSPNMYESGQPSTMRRRIR